MSPDEQRLKPIYYCLVVAYNGTHFNGWQKQPHDSELAAKAAFAGGIGGSVQFHFEQALKKIFPIDPFITLASGRTDAGVHALAQHVQFYFPEFADSKGLSELEKIPRFRLLKDPEQLQKAINAHLVDGIVVIRVKGWMPEGYHVQKSALGKHYVYRFQPKKIDLKPFRNPFTHYEKSRLDLAAMIKAASLYQGEHDFNGFRNTGTQLKSTVRTVYLSKLIVIPPVGKIYLPSQEATYEFHVIGNGFLKQMVRNLMGCLLLLGQNLISVEQIKTALENGECGFNRFTAPPEGLFLVEVFYEGAEMNSRLAELQAL